MEISAKEYTLKVNHRELRDLIYGLIDLLKKYIKESYVNRQHDWQACESDKLAMLEKMCKSLDMMDAYNHIFEIAEATFKEYNLKNPQIKGNENT